MNTTHTALLIYILYGLGAAFMIWVLWNFIKAERRR